MPEWMWANINDVPLMSKDTEDESAAPMLVSHQTLASLWKSYSIICGILDNFRSLCEASFSTSYYSLLVKHTDKDVAEVVRITGDLIDSIKTGIEMATVQIRDGDIDPGSIDLHLRVCLIWPLCDALGIFRIAKPESLLWSGRSVLSLCRVTALWLDLALVSYAGSHGLLFDRDFLNIDTPSMEINCGEANSFRLESSLQKLACLDHFLDHKEIWVFRGHAGQTPTQTSGSNTTGGPLSILCRMEDFADLWGPVWTIPLENDPKRVRQYNTSKGVICRVPPRPADIQLGILKCHWFSWSSFQRRCESAILTSEKEYSMEKDDLLLIGMEFREKVSCRYGMEAFERSYANDMGVLGTSKSVWRLDTRGAGLSFSRLVGISLQGTQKLIPETTLKQHILDKWVNSPQRANPWVLNQLHGVEISHCTGNAQRISLKELMLTRAVSPILERQIPGWSRTSWGSFFKKALQSEDPKAVFAAWKIHKQKRPEMAELVCIVLETLNTTGMRNGGFTAAFLHNDQERSIEIHRKRNEWSNLLRDSRKTAVYAFLNKKCIECLTPDHRAATCDNYYTLTVLKLKMASSGPISDERVKLRPQGRFFKVVEKPRSRTLVVTPALRIGSLFSTPVEMWEIRDRSAQCGQSYDVFVQASHKGYSGMKYPKDRSAIQRPRGLFDRLPNLAPAAGDATTSRSRAPGGFISNQHDNSQRTQDDSSYPIDRPHFDIPSELRRIRGSQEIQIAPSRETRQGTANLSNFADQFVLDPENQPPYHVTHRDQEVPNTNRQPARRVNHRSRSLNPESNQDQNRRVQSTPQERRQIPPHSSPSRTGNIRDRRDPPLFWGIVGGLALALFLGSSQQSRQPILGSNTAGINGDNQPPSTP